MAKVFELINNQQKYEELLGVISNTLDYAPQHQLTIYEQFPKAKQLATMEHWNACGRRVLRGRRAIRLNSENGAIYLFDISQTYVNNNASQREAHWSYNKEYNALFSQVLCNEHGIAYNGEDLELCIDKVINHVLNIADDNSRAAQLRNFAKISSEYVILSRLGIDISSHIFDFSMFSSLTEKEFASVIITINSVSRSMLKYAQDVMENSQEYVNKLNEDKAENSEHKQEEHSIQFGLFGNGITAYDISRIDKETNDYPTVAHISSEGVITTYDDNISDEDMERIKSQAEYARKSFMDEWNKLSVEQQYQRLLDRADVATLTNISSEPRGTLSSEARMKYAIDKYMPFVFFKEGERPKPNSLKEKELSQDKSSVQDITFIGDNTNSDIVKSIVHNNSSFFGTTISDRNTLTIVIRDNADKEDVRRLVEAAQSNGFYLNVPSAKFLESKFGADFMQKSRKNTVADLEVGDIIMYDGSRREVESISNKNISLKNLDTPDLGGVLLGTSDVLAYDGWQEDMERKGFEIISKSAKDEHNIDLMSDAAEVEDIVPPVNVEPVVLEYQGNVECIEAIEDKALSVGATCTISKDETYIVIQTDDIYENELNEVAETLGLTVNKEQSEKVEKDPLFNNTELKITDYKVVTIREVGDFYEMYGDSAKIGEEVLGLHMLSKNGEPMVGFPDKAKDEYLKKLQDAGYNVLAEKVFELNPPKRKDKVEIGDLFRDNITHEVSRVISLEGALPFYTGECTAKRQCGAFEITENISCDRLLNSDLYSYIGNAGSMGKRKPVSKSISVKNLSQLKKAIKPGMMFEITDHVRPECIGEYRIVKSVNTVDFTSQKLNENGEPTGKELHMNFGRAKDWTFNDGELTSKLANGETLISFHFIDSLERKLTSAQAAEAASSDDEILDLTAQDENVRK